MTSLVSAWTFFTATCGRCGAEGRSESYPAELGMRVGDIVSEEWAYDAGWRVQHDEVHCPSCAALCRKETCPPRTKEAQVMHDLVAALEEQALAEMAAEQAASA